MKTASALIRPLALAGLLLVPSLLAAAGPAEASQPDARWQAWIGCWEPATAAALEQAEPAPAAVVCVLPAASGDGVTVATVVDGRVVAQERLEATGARLAVEREGCTGWESLTWSSDGRRLFRQAEYGCGGDIRRESSGLMAILPSGEWLDVHGVSVAGQTGVRVQRYRAASRPAALEAEMAAAVAGRGFALEAARTSATARLTVADVTEATRHLDAAVLEGWLIEQGQGFALDARRLLALADAGVPERVIDVMVALSYPRHFAVDRDAREAELRAAEGAGRYDDRRRAGPVVMMDPWYPGYGWGYDRRYGYGGYGYDGFGYRWYSGRPAVIVVRPPETEERPRARAVNGRGYTRGDDAGRSSGGASTSRDSGGSGSSSAGSSGGSSSGSDGSRSGTGRTAKPRGGG
jgi:uncharacterized membrane protein YgcG